MGSVIGSELNVRVRPMIGRPRCRRCFLAERFKRRRTLEPFATPLGRASAACHPTGVSVLRSSKMAVPIGRLNRIVRRLTGLNALRTLSESANSLSKGANMRRISLCLLVCSLAFLEAAPAVADIDVRNGFARRRARRAGYGTFGTGVGNTYGGSRRGYARSHGQIADNGFIYQPGSGSHGFQHGTTAGCGCH